VIRATLEGLRSSVLPCSVVLILLVGAVALGSRRMPVFSTVAAWMGAVVAIWARASGAVDASRWIGLGLALLTVGVAAVWVLAAEVPTVSEVTLAFFPGALAGWLWQPCVGEALGEILQQAERQEVSSVVSLGFYVAGILTPVAVLALLLTVAKGRAVRLRTTTGAALAALVAVLVLGGWESQVLGWLARMSV
jgi:cytochrome c biogenesis protein CcdA